MKLKMFVFAQVTWYSVRGILTDIGKGFSWQCKYWIFRPNLTKIALQKMLPLWTVVYTCIHLLIHLFLQ